MEPTGIRHVPVEGVVLTDAELDHTLGVLCCVRRAPSVCATAAGADPRARFADPTGDPGVRRGADDDLHLVPRSRWPTVTGLSGLR